MKAAALWATFALLAVGAVLAEDATQWADPPGEETADMARLIDEAEARMGTRAELERTLRDPRYMAVHPYPRFRAAVERHAPIGKLEYAGPPEPGEPMTVRLELRDRAAKPPVDVVVYAYQTSARGLYAEDAAHVRANSGDLRHARLFGYVRAGADGRVELRTIRPAGYPNSELPQHIHLIALREGRAIGGTEIQFSDDPRWTGRMLDRSREEAPIVTTPVKRDGRWVVEATWVVPSSPE